MPVFKASCWYPIDDLHGQQIESLRLGGEGGPPGALAAALDALLLPGGPPLVLLELTFDRLEPWRLAAGVRLASLSHLRLVECCGDGGVEEALEVLLPHVRAGIRLGGGRGGGAGGPAPQQRPLQLPWVMVATDGNPAPARPPARPATGSLPARPAPGALPPASGPGLAATGRAGL